MYKEIYNAALPDNKLLSINNHLKTKCGLLYLKT